MAVEKQTVDCGESLVISNAANLHKQFSEAMEQSTKIELVCESVSKVDTAGLQVLIALSQELEKVNGELIWKDPSDTVVKAITTLGLTPYLSIN